MKLEQTATSTEGLVPLDRPSVLPASISQSFVTGLARALDCVASVASGLLIHWVYVDSEQLMADAAAIGLYTLLLVLALQSAGLYRFTSILEPRRHLGTLAAIIVATFLSLIALAFAFKISDQFSRLWAFSWLLTSTGMIIASRLTLAHGLTVLAKSGRIGRRIAIYGGGRQAEKLIERIERLNEPWNRIVGVFDDRLSRTASTVGGYPVLGNLDALIRYGRMNQPDEILIALPWSAEERLLAITQLLAVLPANIRLCPEFMREDAIHGRASSQFGLLMLSAFEKPVAGWGALWKRTTDLVTAVAMLVILSPVLVLVAVLIKLESRGPVLFRQPRYGFNSEMIEVFKFRTMKAASTDLLGDRLTERDDPRVTRVGAFLRRFSLDELPQLINVFRGEMSVVGPRPHAVRTTAGGRPCEEVADQYAVRHKVKPGITGWAQVNGWRGTMADEQHLLNRVEHDLYYIQNWSPLFDLKILLLTVWTVINGRNSY